MTRTVIGVFLDSYNAEDAIGELESRGYNPKDMSLVMRNMEEGERIVSDTGANVVGGAATGATTGALIGGLAGLLTGIGALAIPGLGAFLIGGPLATSLGLTGAAATTISGAATGAVAGGLIGALMGLGIPEEDAKMYEERIKEGGILLAIPVNVGETSEVEAILDSNDADQIRTISSEETRIDYEFPTRYSLSEYPPAGVKGGKTGVRRRRSARRR